MSASEVYLERDADPVFPSRCIVCLEPDPDSEMVVSDRQFRWASIVVPFLMFSGEKKTVRLPVCYGCRGTYRMQRLRRALLLWPGFVGSILLGIYIADQMDVERGTRRWIAVGIAIVGVLPAAFWEVLRPPYFTLQCGEKRVEYWFGDREYAEEFAALNGAEVEEE